MQDGLSLDEIIKLGKNMSGWKKMPVKREETRREADMICGHWIEGGTVQQWIRTTYESSFKEWDIVISHEHYRDFRNKKSEGCSHYWIIVYSNNIKIGEHLSTSGRLKTFFEEISSDYEKNRKEEEDAALKNTRTLLKYI